MEFSRKFSAKSEPHGINSKKIIITDLRMSWKNTLVISLVEQTIRFGKISEATVTAEFQGCIRTLHNDTNMMTNTYSLKPVFFFFSVNVIVNIKFQ